MFLDEQLSEIYQKWEPQVLSQIQCKAQDNEPLLCMCTELFQACVNKYRETIPEGKLTDKQYRDTPAVVKQIDNSFQLFCKKSDTYHLLRADAWRRLLYFKVYKDEEGSAARLFKFLGWEIPEKI